MHVRLFGIVVIVLSGLGVVFGHCEEPPLGYWGQGNTISFNKYAGHDAAGIVADSDAQAPSDSNSVSAWALAHSPDVPVSPSLSHATALAYRNVRYTAPWKRTEDEQQALPEGQWFWSCETSWQASYSMVPVPQPRPDVVPYYKGRVKVVLGYNGARWLYFLQKSGLHETEVRVCPGTVSKSSGETRSLEAAAEMGKDFVWEFRLKADVAAERMEGGGWNLCNCDASGSESVGGFEGPWLGEE